MISLQVESLISLQVESLISLQVESLISLQVEEILILMELILNLNLIEFTIFLIVCKQVNKFKVFYKQL